MCVFIVGSDAQGCKVVLVGEMMNATVTMMRNGNSTSNSISHTLPFPLSCYHQVYALDIEADGANGSLPVPGVIEATTTAEQCFPVDELASPQSN